MNRVQRISIVLVALLAFCLTDEGFAQVDFWARANGPYGGSVRTFAFIGGSDQYD